MDGAGSDYDEKAAGRVGALHYGDGFIARGDDGCFGLGSLVGCEPGEDMEVWGRGITWEISCWSRSGGVNGL